MIRFVISLLVAVSFALVNTTGVCAQSFEAPSLKGLKSLKLVMEDIPTNDCGVTTADVKSSVQFILTQSRIRLVQSSTSFIYVNVNVFSNCSAASVELAIGTPVMIVSTRRVVGAASVWHDGTLLGGANDMQDRVMESVEHLMKKLVVDWSSANPPT